MLCSIIGPIMVPLARSCIRVAGMLKGGGSLWYYLGKGMHRARPKIPVCYCQYWYTTDSIVTNDETPTKKARKSTSRKSRVLPMDELEPATGKKQKKAIEEVVVHSPTVLNSDATALENCQELDLKVKKTRKSKKAKDKPTDDVVKRKKKRRSKAEKPEDSLSEDTVTVGKRKGRGKKVTEEPTEIIGPFIPFEGTVVSSDESHTFHSINRHNSSEGRFYSLQSTTENYLFPSVTTVLDNTMDNSSSFRLLHWKRNLIKLHGQKDFEMIAKNTMNSGANFHKMLENRLLASESSPHVHATEQGETTSLDITKLPISFNEWPSDLSDGVCDDGGEATSMYENKVTSSDRGVCENECDSEATSDLVLDSDEAVCDDDNKVTSEDSDEAVCGDDTSEDSEEAVCENDDTLKEESPLQLNLRRMQSVEHVLRDISEVKALEMSVTHIPLGYTGTFDCLAMYKGVLCLIDWKTSKKPKPTLEDCYDNPLQAVAYAGAINQDPSINFKVLNILIVVVYETGEPAHAHYIDQETCEKYWLKWTGRLQSYQTQFSEDLSEIIN